MEIERSYMTEKFNIGSVQNSLIKQLENKVNNNPNQINTKTPDMPNDKVELSTKKDENKSLYKKIALAAAAVLAVAGTVVYVKKHPDKADDVIKQGKQKIEEAEKEAKKAVEEKTEKTKEEAQKAAEEAKKVAEEKAAKAKEKAKIAREEQKAIAEKKRLEEIYQRDIKQVNEILSDAIGKTDDEVAGLLREKYNEEILGPSFNIKRALIYNKNIAAEVLIEKAGSVKDPVEKERLLSKAVDFVQEEISPSNESANFEKLEEIKLQLKNLYKTEGVEFKSKDTIIKAIVEKSNKIFNQTDEAKKLKEALGSEADYSLYKKLCEKSKNYENVWHEKTDPMVLLAYTDLKRDKSINVFLHDILPKLIKEEKNIVKQEDLYFKYLNVTREYTNGNKHTNESFDVLNEMSDLFYKKEVKLPKGESLKYKEEIQSQLKETMDEFIFKKFDLPSIKTDEEKIALAKKVINRSNVRVFYLLPDQVETAHITKALVKMGIQNKNEKYIENAIDLAMSKNEKKYASELINDILDLDENISAGLKEKLIKIREDFKTASKKAAEEISATIKSKSLEQAFEAFTSRPETKEAIKEFAQKTGNSEAQIIEKMQQGDGEVIRNIVKKSIYKTGAEKWMSDLKSTPVWDDIITYLDKVDDIVKDKVELEYLQNIRLRALAANVHTTKAAYPEKSEGYREILRSHVTNMLYGKAMNGKLAQENIDENAVNKITNYLETLVWVPVPETTMYGAIERILEKPYGLSENTINALKTKMEEIKTRLKIKTEEDYYDEFFNRFKSGKTGGAGSASSKLTKETAIDTLNKYIEGDKLKADSTKDEIKAAYRCLALKYHPDTCKEADKAAYEDIFKEIGEAYSLWR